MPLMIHNSLSGKLEKFVPIRKGKVLMYSCGPTVYDYFHIGNARTFLVSDLIRRYLIHKGFDVKFVQNLTDIDDKIINRSNQMGVSADQVSQKYIDGYFEDADDLGIQHADVNPKATDHLPEMIAIIQDLIDKDYAYESGGDVYYRVTKFDDYGKLSNRNLDDLLAGARVEINPKKEDPRDFDLWKTAKLNEPFWESPWGDGRPGWHLECSAMVMKHLGETIDIHAGGHDLLFPHHENEIAQSEAVTGKPFARYWLHTGFLRVNGDRMGKSQGNFILTRDALKNYSAETIRHFLISAHYRGPLDFNPNSLAESEKAIRRLKNCLSKIEDHAEKWDATIGENSQIANKVVTMRSGFFAAMDNDFNTPEAIGKIYTLIGEINRFFFDHPNPTDADRSALSYAHENLIDVCQILGIYEPPKTSNELDSDLVDQLMNLIIDLRQDARSRKDWSIADKIRDDLAEIGLELQDSPSGTNWREIEN